MIAPRIPTTGVRVFDRLLVLSGFPTRLFSAYKVPPTSASSTAAMTVRYIVLDAIYNILI